MIPGGNLQRLPMPRTASRRQDRGSSGNANANRFRMGQYHEQGQTFTINIDLTLPIQALLYKKHNKIIYLHASIAHSAQVMQVMQVMQSPIL